MAVRTTYQTRKEDSYLTSRHTEAVPATSSAVTCLNLYVPSVGHESILACTLHLIVLDSVKFGLNNFRQLNCGISDLDEILEPRREPPCRAFIVMVL